MQRTSWIFKNDKKRVDDAVKILCAAENSIVYYGTDVYLSQRMDFSQRKFSPDAECRRFMDWTLATRKNTERFSRTSNTSRR